MKKDKNATTASRQVNQQILNVITPAGIDFTDTHANVGDAYGKIYAVSKFPTDGVEYGWASQICKLEGTCTEFDVRYGDPSFITNVYNRKISDLRADRDLVKNESEKQQIDEAIKDLEEMIRRISVQNEPVAYVNTMLFIQDITEKALNDRVKRVSGRMAVNGMNLRLLRYKQKEALQVFAPYGAQNPFVACVGERNMPLSSFFGGFPMAASGIRDEGGFYIGKTGTDDLIFLNQWLRNKDRVNSNWFITGLPGSGKSTFLKTMDVKELAFGTKFIIFDPEEEYIDLARHSDIKGDVIDCAGGSTGRINPLQVRVAPRVTQADLEAGESIEDYLDYGDDDISDLALHIQNLRVFFKLYFGADNYNIVKTALEEALIEMYKDKGIVWDTDISSLKNEDFPIMEDLCAVVKRIKETEGLSEYRKNNFDRLADLLFPIGEGADKYIWNGYTTINPQSKFVVLNMSKLLDLDENVKRAQFMNLTMWAWQQLAADRSEKTLLAVDEGYLFVDPDMIDLLKFMRNISKRARKYEAGIMFITHSVVDVLDPEVKRLGQALIDNACYKFIMGCDGKNLEETKKLFNLTEKQENILSAKNRGQGILFAGSVRVEMQVDVCTELLEMFGSAGGR